MRAAPALTVQYAPFDVINHQRGDIRTDLELIRALGRELLGDVTGARLAREKAAPPPMIDWLRLPARRARSRRLPDLATPGVDRQLRRTPLRQAGCIRMNDLY